MRAIKAGLIFVLVLLATIAFTPQAGHLWNPQQVTRLALAISLLEGRTDIDPFMGRTVDIAASDGHFYADKPPGLSMLAVPGVAAARALLENPDPFNLRSFATYLSAAILTTNGFFGALAASVIYLFALRLGATERGALIAAVALALGTPFFGWSTVFFAHVTAGSLLLIALAIAGSGEAWAGRGLMLGGVLGVLLVVDLTQAPAAALIGLFCLLNGASAGKALERLGPPVLGGALGLLPLLIYGQLAFGSPFRLGYAEVVGFDGMKQGFFGLTTPSPAVAAEILFGLHRGLLPLAPVLLVVPVGLAALWREQRNIALVIAGAMVFAVLVNASYFYWDGGSATGPRHLVAMLPLACLALAFVAPKGPVARAGFAALLLVSLVISGICAATEMFSGTDVAMPFFEDVLPRFLGADPIGRIAPLLISWIGFLGLFLWPQRDQLTALPLEATAEIELQEEG